MLKIVQHERYEKMFYVEWPDGVKSQEFYNIERCREFIRRMERGVPPEGIYIGYSVGV